MPQIMINHKGHVLEVFIIVWELSGEDVVDGRNGRFLKLFARQT